MNTNPTKEYSEDGLEMENGGVLCWPDADDNGAIRYVDDHGNVENIWRIGETNYEEYRKLFPDDALYFQPDEAGDPDAETSAKNIKSYQVYRNLDVAQAAHPDCEILTFSGTDIEGPKFLDVDNPQLYFNEED